MPLALGTPGLRPFVRLRLHLSIVAAARCTFRYACAGNTVSFGSERAFQRQCFERDICRHMLAKAVSICGSAVRHVTAPRSALHLLRSVLDACLGIRGLTHAVSRCAIPTRVLTDKQHFLAHNAHLQTAKLSSPRSPTRLHNTRRPEGLYGGCAGTHSSTARRSTVKQQVSSLEGSARTLYFGKQSPHFWNLQVATLPLPLLVIGTFCSCGSCGCSCFPCCTCCCCASCF